MIHFLKSRYLDTDIITQRNGSFDVFTSDELVERLITV